MTTYEERRDNLAASASVMVQVLLGADNRDVEFMSVAPQPATEEARRDLRSQWSARQLRAVGFLGLVGAESKAVFREPLGPECVEALATAFGVYVAALFTKAITSGAFAEEVAHAECNELMRVWSLPDSRIN